MDKSKVPEQSSERNMPLSRELLRKVRMLELRTRLQVRDVFGGRYHSVFKGQGMDFSEVREYAPGDDIRSIDWNVSARMDHPYVKIYREERELTVLLLVDVSASGKFGTDTSLKREVAGELTALLTLSAMFNNDKVGLLLFSDYAEHFVAPNKGQRHALRLIRDVLAYQPKHQGTKISSAVEFVLRAARKKAVIFLISDFQDDGWQSVIRVASRKHDLIAIELYDPRERELPSVGLLPLRDTESDEILWVDTSSALLRRDFAEQSAKQSQARSKFFKQNNIDRMELPINKPYMMELVKFFRTRERRK